MPICTNTLAFKKHASDEWIELGKGCSTFLNSIISKPPPIPVKESKRFGPFTVTFYAPGAKAFFKMLQKMKKPYDIIECHGCNPFLKIFC